MHMARVLLVEDSPEVTWIVERLARRGAVALEACGDVAAAEEALRRGRPDLVLLDRNLPGEPGDEWCRRLRRDPFLTDLPVALFAHPDCREDIAAGLEAGVDYVVSKDLLATPDAWLARLHELMPSGGGRAAPPPVRWSMDLLPSPSLAGVEALNRVLRHPLARQLGPDILRVVLFRALRGITAACGSPAASDAESEADQAASWLRPDGLSLDPERILRSGPPGTLVAFATALAEQWWCLCGTEGGAPLQEALAAAVERLCD
jgi:CheY-like chemotaxis protein